MRPLVRSSPRGRFLRGRNATINRSHPLANGLLFYGLDKGDGVIVDLISGQANQSVGTVDSPTVSMNGPAVKYAGAGSRFFNSTSAVQAATATGNAFSVACAYIQTGTVGSFTRPFGRTANNGGSAPFLNWDFEINPSGSGQNVVNFNLNNGTAATITTWNSNANNVFTSLVSTNTGSANIGYAQGLQVGTNTISSQSTNTQDSIMFSGSSSAAAASEFIGFVFYGAFWKRVLTPGEVLQLHLDPYCFLSFNDEIPAMSVAAGGGGFTAKFRRTLSQEGTRVGSRQRAA